MVDDYGLDYERLLISNKTTIWKRKFAFLPHQCQNTGKCIWMKWGYQQIFVDGFDDKHISWISEDQFLLMVLKGLK